MMIETLIELVLVAASTILGVFCLVLAKRLRKLNDLETGLGGAIAVMAAEVDRLEAAIISARQEATQASEALSGKIASARKERAVWELRQKIANATPATTIPTAARRLRKKVGGLDA